MWQAIQLFFGDARIRAVAVALVLLGFTYASTIPYQSLIATQQLGMSERQFGVLIFLIGLFGTFGGLVLGYLSDISRNRKTSILWCLIAGAFGFSAFALWPNFITFLVCMLLVYPFSGSAYSMLFATVRSIANELDANQAASVNSAVRSFYALSWIVVPAIVGGFIAYSGRPSDGFVIGALAFVVCLIFYWRFGPNIAGTSISAGSAAANLREALGLITQEGRMTRLSALALVNCPHPLIMSAFPLIIAHELGGTMTQLGVVAGLVAFLEMPLMLGVGAAVRRLPLWQVIVAGGIIHAVFLVALTLIHSTAPLYGLAVLNAAGNAVLLTQHLTFAQELLPERPGLGSSLLSITNLLSRAAAALLFGSIGWAYGIHGALWAGAVVCILGCVGIAALSRMNPK
jgi:predicted MFS family arabinose efflux permease